MSPLGFLLACILCLALSMAGRHLILTLCGHVFHNEWHWTGAFRKVQWRYLGGCLSWDQYDGHDIHVTDSTGTTIHYGHRNCVLGFYILNWRWHMPQDDGYVWGWAFGPFAYSYTTY
ncbi:hypothetical protein [Xanthomonas phage SB3]|uniref:Secreted protein n=1 Tax=Xanthomonas phage SB3 TaxID=3117472 RepID=A0ABZ2GYB3_9CAUD